MPLEQSDLQQISDLISGQFDSFLKEKVAPMVSGATKRALSEAPQLTADTLQEQLETLTRNLQEQAKPVDHSKLVQDSVNAVLQQLADMPDDEQPAGAGKPQPAAVDEEALSKRLEEKLMAQFEETKLKPVMKKLGDYEKQVEVERQARLSAERATLIGQRNQKYTDAFSKAMGGADPVAAGLALDTAIKMGYIKPNEDESDFVVEGMDQFGLEKVFTPAIEKLADVVSKPELQYFIPARSGTGTGSAPARNLRPQSGPQLQVLPPDADELSAEALFAAMQADPGKVLADLAALDKAS